MTKQTTVILVDMTWWLGTSRQRGIGVYLKALFTHYYDWQGFTPLWYVPKTLSAQERQAFRSTYPRGTIIASLDEILPAATSDAYDKRRLHQPKHHIMLAITGSPFERPRSLLNDVDRLNREHIPLQVVIHDLLPLEFPRRILQTWTKPEQLLYQTQFARLAQTATIFATGKEAQRQLRRHAPELIQKVQVLPFGETTSWLAPPADLNRVNPPLSAPYVITITGGEWRKNVVSTLQFFALKLPRSWRLVVIGKLGRRERIKFILLSWYYGLCGRVVWLGEVSEKDKWLYLSGARLLLSLSYGEGLNLPVLEAKAVDVPALTVRDLPRIYAEPIDRPLDLLVCAKA